MKKSLLLLAALLGLGFAFNTDALFEESSIVAVQLQKPIERSEDLQYLHRGRGAKNWEPTRINKARHMLPRRMRNSNNRILWARKEQAGSDDVMAPAKNMNYSFHWKNRRLKIGAEYQMEYYNLYKKPELAAKKTIARASRYNRQPANSLDSDRSGREKLYRLYYSQ